MIELRNITVSLPHGSPNAARILDNVTLEITSGDWITLIGSNGCGKTTLLQTIAGLRAPDTGELHSAGERIALLLQEPDNQFVAGSVYHELLLSLPAEMDDHTGQSRLSQAIDQFSLGHFLDRNPHRLSGGEKQRVAFASVWLSDPRLLLLDEPTSYLDSVERERCVGFVRELNDAGVSIVWATPSRADAPESGRVVHMDNGRITFDGDNREYDVSDQTVGPANVGDGQHVAQARQTDGTSGSSIVLMQSVSYAYDDTTVLEGFSSDLVEGECIAVTGRNGAGKSTLLGLLGGVFDPTAGTMRRMYEKAVSEGQQNIFYLFQNPERLFFAETVFEEIAFGLKSLKTPRATIDERVDDALSRVGLPPSDFRNRLPFSLSLGEMRRLAFAITLALDPRLLLMDEPASCLDAEGHAVLANLIARFKSRGRTVVVASHNIESIATLFDRVIDLDADD